jgi:hypothetical protein
MEAVDGVSPEIARIFAAKEQRRQDLARLPYPEKVRTISNSKRWPQPFYARGEKWCDLGI